MKELLKFSVASVWSYLFYCCILRNPLRKLHFYCTNLLISVSDVATFYLVLLYVPLLLSIFILLLTYKFCL